MHRLFYSAFALLFLVTPATVLFNYANAGGSRDGGETSTQYVLAYTVTDTRPCRIEVSQSPGYAPLVHAVDPTLYPASDVDGLTVAGPRVFVVGRRDVLRASNGRYYSRALEANTTHYYRITGCAASAASGTGVSCSPAGCTGSFTTMNIPWGNTWADVTPAQFPTGFSTDRTKNYIDPLTGAKVFLLTRYNGANADFDTGSPTTGANGTAQICATTLVSNGAGSGYHCNIGVVTGDVATYWIKNDGSGNANFIGLAHFAAGKDVNGESYQGFYLGGNADPWDTTNGNVMYSTDCTYVPCDNKLVKVTYTGNDSFPGKNVTLNAHSTKLVLTRSPNTIPALVHAFDSTFDTATFTNCGVSSVQQHWIIGNCTYAGQQSPAWMWVYDLNTSAIVAAAASYTNIQSRWCGSHGTVPPGQSPFIFFGTANLTYEVTLGSDVAAGDTAFTISGQPVGTPSRLKLTQAGDYFSFEDNGEIVKVVTTNAGSTSWTVLRGQDSNGLATSHAAGRKLNATCTGQGNAQGKYVPVGITKFWDFVNDPHGKDATGTYFVSDHYSGCHEIERPGIKSHCDEAGAQMIWSSNANIFATLNQPPDFRIADHPLFAGFNDLSIGFHQSHPSYDQTQAAASEQTYIQDIRPFLGGSDGISLVAGKTYIYKYSVIGPHVLDSTRPYFGLAGADGKTRMADISGPSSVLVDDAGHNNTMCIAKNADECITGSAPGDIYVNRSTPLDYQCGYTCIWNSSPFADSIVQLGTVKPSSGQQGTASDGSRVYGAQRSRSIVRGLLGPIRVLSQYANTHILPDASLTLFEAPWIDGVNGIIAAAKVPPQPIDDGIDRSHYESVKVACSGADKFCRLRYGYEENEPTRAISTPVIGSTMHFYCTQRKEQCDTSPKSANQPQSWFIGVPQQVLWYEIQYCRDPNCGSITSTEALCARAIP